MASVLSCVRLAGKHIPLSHVLEHPTVVLKEGKARLFQAGVRRLRYTRELNGGAQLKTCVLQSIS
eukprot:737454-Pelagomonas_calceolata.AAC.1